MNRPEAINSAKKIVIEGVTEDGRPFRPSDWIERISGSLSTFGNDRRMRYSHYLQPQMVDGKRCLVLDPALRERNPAAFNFLLDFAKGNKLRIHDPDMPQPQAKAEPVVEVTGKAEVMAKAETAKPDSRGIGRAPGAAVCTA